MEDEDIPKVVLQKDLMGLDDSGRPCEACSNPMKDHDWVVMDINGFVLVCCFSGWT